MDEIAIAYLRWQKVPRNKVGLHAFGLYDSGKFHCFFCDNRTAAFTGLWPDSPNMKH